MTLRIDGALGMPEDEAGAGQLLNAEEVELLAQQAMVALGRFFKAGEVRVEILLREEGGAVDALQAGDSFRRLASRRRPGRVL